MRLRLVTGPINAGCYMLPSDILSNFPLGEPFSLKADIVVIVVAKQRFDLFVANGHFIEIGMPGDHSRTHTELTGLCH